MPLNVNNDSQSMHFTSKMEFKSKLVKAGVHLDKNKDIGFVTHYTAKNVSYIERGARAAALLRDMGYEKAYDGAMLI